MVYTVQLYVQRCYVLRIPARSRCEPTFQHTRYFTRPATQGTVRWGLGINSTVRPALTDNPPAYIYVPWPDYGPLRESRKPGLRSRMEKEPMHSWMRDTATHFFKSSEIFGSSYRMSNVSFDYTSKLHAIHFLACSNTTAAIRPPC